MNILDQAGDLVSRKWKSTGRGWKVVLVIAVVIIAILSMVALALWFLGRLVKGLTVGGFQNRSLYIPSMRVRRG